MTNQDEPPSDGPPPGDDPAGDFPRPSLLEVLERAGTAGEALEILAAACPGTPHAEILAALDEHAAALRRKAAEMTDEAAAVERLSAVLAELVRRLGEGAARQPASDRQSPNQPPVPEPGDSGPYTKER
ncbi:MAG: hypothetical protein IH786_03095 [Proteobacteria bacterium]|nr:hypothetical protein [Pseudomonadota bacterium]